MDHIISQILEIDAQAQKKLQDAYEQKDVLKAQADADVDRAAADLRTKCENRIQKVYAAEKAEADAQIAEIRKALAVSMTRLEAQFFQNESKWVTDVVNAVLQG